MYSSSIDHLDPDNWGRQELTEEDLDFVRKLLSGEWVVFQVPLGGGRYKTRYWRQLGRKVQIVDWPDGGETA
jgi:hypothetical protein